MAINVNPSIADLGSPGLIKFTDYLNAHQETAAAAIFGSAVVTRPGALGVFSISLRVCGTGGGPTAVKVTKRPGGTGTPVDVATLSIAHDAADGTAKSTSTYATEAAQKVEAGDVLQFECTAASTGGAVGLTATLEINTRFDGPAANAAFFSGVNP